MPWDQPKMKENNINRSPDNEFHLNRDIYVLCDAGDLLGF